MIPRRKKLLKLNIESILENDKEESDEKEKEEEKTTSSNIDKSKIRAALITFFKKNKKPSDTQVHEFAEKMGIDPHTFEEQIYALLSSLLSENDEEDVKKNMKTLRENIERFTQVLKRSGESKNESDEKYNPDELWVGIQVEKEHHHDEQLAKEITKDHLKEIPDYYTRLLKLEMEAGQKISKEWLKRLNIA